MRRHWNTIVTALVLVRIGQELGTDSELTRGIARLIDALVGLATKIPG